MALLTHAKAELAAAKQSLSRLEQSAHLDELDAHWKAFIRHLERSWFKAQAELKMFSKWQGWPERGRIQALRGDDALLAYLQNARGAEEHGVDPIAARTGGSIGINAAVPGGALRIDEMKLDKGTLSIKSRHPFRIHIEPAQYALLDVVNRGRRYAVPNVHLGVALDRSDPVTLARAGLAFYEAFIVSAEQNFGQSR